MMHMSYIYNIHDIYIYTLYDVITPPKFYRRFTVDHRGLVSQNVLEL